MVKGESLDYTFSKKGAQSFDALHLSRLASHTGHFAEVLQFNICPCNVFKKYHIQFSECPIYKVSGPALQNATFYLQCDRAEHF